MGREEGGPATTDTPRGRADSPENFRGSYVERLQGVNGGRRIRSLRCTTSPIPEPSVLSLDPHLEQWIRSRRDDIADLAMDLIRIPTENPPGAEYPAVVEVLSRALDGLGLPVTPVDLGDGFVAVTSSVGDGPGLILHGHFDVVPASSEGQFDPRMQAGRIWGRGSADMKGALASMIYSLAALKDGGPASAVTLVMVPGEETGGAQGMSRLVETGFLDDKATGAVLGEPTSDVIWNGSRGALTAGIRVAGRPAHVGLHFEGANAFEGAVPILNALMDLKAEVSQRRTGLSIQPEDAERSILMIGGEVRGGHQFNLVPDGFEFSVERRFNPEEDLDAEFRRLEETVHRHVPEGLSVEVDVFQQARASSVPASHPLVTGLSEVVASVVGRAPKVQMCPGLLESRFYVGAGIPAVAYGPGELEVSHGPEESVALDRLVECALVYAGLACSGLESSSPG